MPPKRYLNYLIQLNRQLPFYKPVYSNILDHHNDIALPGFIDIHTHGYFGGLNIIIKDGVAWIKDTNTIAGSILEMKQAYKNLRELGITANNISKLLSYNQAQLLGLNTGNISPGRVADLCFMDDAGMVTDAMVSGVSVNNLN